MHRTDSCRPECTWKQPSKMIRTELNVISMVAATERSYEDLRSRQTSEKTAQFLQNHVLRVRTCIQLSASDAH